MPALLAFLLSNSRYAGEVDIAGLPVVVANLTFIGLPLALACILIRWRGYSWAAWGALAVLGTMAAVWLVLNMMAAGPGPGFPLEHHIFASGVSATIVGLPAWLGLGIFWTRERRDGRKTGDKT